MFRSASMSDSEWLGKTKGDMTSENSDADKFVPPLPPERKYKPDQIKVSWTNCSYLPYFIMNTYIIGVI